MARSLAFWFDGVANGDEPEAELHFNYWSLDESKIEYLDIGVKLSPKGKYKSVNFYLPFDIKSFKYVPELGTKVCDHNELLSAIFNNTVTKKEAVSATVWDITFSKDDDKLRFHTQILKEETNSPEGVTVEAFDENGNKGAKLSFPSSLVSTTDGDEIGYDYFRFRIILGDEDKKSISHLHKPEGAYLNNNFEKVEMVDFRINERRNLPKKIQDKLNPKSYISAIHFFLIREASSELKMSHTDVHRCRILEKDLWNDYLYKSDDSAKHKTPDQMLIYHWKDTPKEEKPNIEYFSAFAKFTRRHVRKRDLSLAIIIIIVFGFSGSTLSSWVWTLITNNVESQRSQLETDINAAIDRRCYPIENKVNQHELKKGGSDESS